MGGVAHAALLVAYVLLQTLQYQNVYRDVTHLYTTFSNGSLGSRIDEERSEMR